jgi:fatty-acyl-CoA synthase
MNTQNNEHIHLARQHTIGDILRRSAARNSNKVAIRCGGIKWTYSEFDKICNQVGHGLLEKGIKTGDRVAIIARNSHSFAALRFALARLGAVLVPINFMLNASEIGFILKSSGAKVLAIGPEFMDKAFEAKDLDTFVSLTVALPGEDVPASIKADVEFSNLLSRNDSPIVLGLEDTLLAQIVYTSGTESLPKGAMLTHGAILWQYMSCIVDGEMTKADVMLHALPLYHCAQLDVFLGPAIYLGMTNIITGQASPDNILPLLDKHKITSFFAPPSVWIALLRSPLFDATNFQRLTKGYYGASIMPIEILKEMQDRLPKVSLWNLYGQTEIAPLATVLKPEDQLRKPGSAGAAALNVETRVVDEQMIDVKIGEIGEIVHRSPQLLTGYYNDPEKTQVAFKGGWFHSGDLATIDEEGHITVIDRKKDMINSGGENVASREVEECIYLMPEISEVAVIGLPHPRWIETVTAVIVLKEGQIKTEASVIEHCKVNLASFKAPTKVIFCQSLPKNPSGKLLKRELREQHSKQAPS